MIFIFNVEFFVVLSNLRRRQSQSCPVVIGDDDCRHPLFFASHAVCLLAAAELIMSSGFHAELNATRREAADSADDAIVPHH